MPDINVIKVEPPPINITNNSHDSKVQDKIVEISSKLVCYNQGELIQYSFLAAELHKNLKTIFNKSQKNNEEIRKHYDALNAYLNRSLERIFKRNFVFIKEYFYGRSGIEPRVCTKVNFLTEPVDKRVIEAFRDERVSYFTDYSLEDNTGFLYVSENGKFFIENNIPKASKEMRYKNPRLVEEELGRYKEPGRINKFLNKRKFGFIRDEEWQRCWKGDESTRAPLPETSCYKSTLIIPMTLWNNDLDETYKKIVKLEDVDRTIFGYLCFDHVEQDFFNETFDKKFGYILADMLSLFIVNRLVYTKISKTYNKVVELLEQED